MRGRKPEVKNVTPLRPDGPADPERIREATERLVKQLMPRGMSKEMRAEWRRVGRILAEPTVDRLKPRFVDVIQLYCEHCIELRELSKKMPAPGTRFYNTSQGDKQETRNGVQFKSHPNVAQYNACFMRMMNLVTRLGLSPQDDRNILPGQGDLFDVADTYFA